MFSKQKQKRKEIYELFLANKFQGKFFTLKDIKSMSFTEKSIYKIVKHA
jgi:hypothetical protein